MNASYALTDYVLGSNDAEHQQSADKPTHWRPMRSGCFAMLGLRSASALDVGSGVGDVALLAAALVGRSGSVLGIDRDSMALTPDRSPIAPPAKPETKSTRTCG
jgi:precorrin-6B methylase 2